MSFKLVVVGIMCFFGELIALSLIILNMIPPVAFMIMAVALGAIPAFVLMLENILLGDVAGAFLSAKMQNKLIASMVSPSGNIKMYVGKENEGFIIPGGAKGFFNIPKGSIYSWPNGVKGGFGYLRIGSVLPLEFIETASTLKEKGFTDIRHVEKINEETRESGEEVMIELNRGEDDAKSV